MTEARYNQIEKEAKRRLDLWLTHSNFQQMSCDGSYLQFNMSIGLAGCPFIEHWMDEKFIKPFITDLEFYTNEYDEIMFNLFLLAQN